ncbi:hypothetical protein [Halorarum halobium]|uniref:hypothetical protein n=1 Tax=Halorarum halobium TaxID=3075121 RepID=UPI0028B00853|nr:hypothetical protein [Halobaculum sp. XH14]
MGLEEIDIDLEDLISDDDTDSDVNEVDVSDMSKKDVAKKAIKEGQFLLDEDRAAIKCPCSKHAMLGDQVVHYACVLFKRPDPEDGKQKPVCSGPIKGIKEWSSGKRTWKPGGVPRDGCPYSPRRFQRDDL